MTSRYRLWIRSQEIGGGGQRVSDVVTSGGDERSVVWGVGGACLATSASTRAGAMAEMTHRLTA